MTSPSPSTKSRRPDLDTVFSINEDGSRNFVHTADVRGKWQRRKNATYAVLILLYLALPWIRIHGQPALRFDLPNRTAHLLGTAFTNQDFYLVFFLLTGFGFTLFVVTALFGRIWCGWACPQTVFTEGVYRRVERWIEGSRERRLRRNSGPWTWDRVWRKSLKHGIYFFLAAVIAHAFLAYFIPVDRLFGYLRSGPADHWVAFGWTVFWTGVLYFDYSWFREQTCLIICPYGRLQSALIDEDTIVIGYDEGRGEPRSKRTESGGDCVDCFRCVSVCPTGIDIRRGLQMECIGCANCIDACDEVMEKIGRKKGLIRYDSHQGFLGGAPRSLVRPRVFLYGVLALLGLTVFATVASRRTAFEVRVLRPRGLPYSLVEDKVRNLYTLRIQNKTDLAATYLIVPESAPDNPTAQFIVAQPRVRVEGLADIQVPVFADLPRSAYQQPFSFEMVVRDSSSGKVRRAEVRFRGP